MELTEWSNVQFKQTELAQSESVISSQVQLMIAQEP